MSNITTVIQIDQMKTDAIRYWGDLNSVKVSVMSLSSFDFVSNNIAASLQGNVPFIKLTINPFNTNPNFTWSLFHRSPYSFDITPTPKNNPGRTLNISMRTYRDLFSDAVSKLDEPDINNFDRIDGFCAIMCKDDTEKIYVYFTFFKRKDGIEAV